MSDSPKTEVRPPRGLTGDIHRARAGATATAGELREFVNQLHGRSPQEMLGIVAGSSLIRSTIAASVITVVFMFGFTAGPYVWKKWFPKQVVATKTEPEAPAAAAAAAPTGTAATPAGSAATANLPATAGAAPAGPAGPKDPLAPLGINETKIADPKKNPLDNSTDDLLKDLK